MVSPAIRFSLCLLIGLFAGSILGLLFVPNPTGIVAAALAATGTALIAWYLYRSDWLREEANAAP